MLVKDHEPWRSAHFKLLCDRGSRQAELSKCLDSGERLQARYMMDVEVISTGEEDVNDDCQAAEVTPVRWRSSSGQREYI